MFESTSMRRALSQKAIDKALSNISVKYEPYAVELKDLSLLPVLENIKDKCKETNPFQFERIVASGYDNWDEYTHDGLVYYVGWNNDTPEEKHLFKEMMMEVSTGLVTDKPWRANNQNDSYMHGCTPSIVEYKNETVPFPEPSGRLFFNNLI